MRPSFFYKPLLLLLLSVSVYANGPDTTAWLKQAQSGPDTARARACLQLSDYFMRKDFDRSAGFANKAIVFAQKSGFKKAEAAAINYLGEIHYRKGEFDEAMAKFSKAKTMYEALKDREGVAESQNHIGTVYYKTGDNENALKNFTDALHVFDETKSSSGLTATYINIGLVYDNLRSWKKAIEYYNKAIEYGKETNDEGAIASCYNNLGGVYTDMKQYDMALECLERSRKLKEKTGNKAGVAGTLNNIGAIYYEMKNFKKALEYFQKAYLIKKEIDDKNGMISSLNNIGAVYYEAKDYPQAEKYMLEGYHLALRTGSKSLAVDCLDGLIGVYRNMGDYKKAYEHKELMSAYKDTLFNIESAKSTQEVQARFETEKRDKENEILNLQLKNESFVKYIFIGAAGVLLLLAFFIFRGLRQKQKANVELEGKNRIIEEQKHVVEEQNKDITDSIKYAERIQKAIFPPEKMWNTILPDSFVFFRPKDILSGDFYWAEQKGDLIFIAAADCTGHGVPGALISIVNYNLLNKAVLEKDLTDPADVLNAVNKWLTDSLHQTFQESTVRDGMDVSLCVINRKTLEMKFAGANNPVYVINKAGLTQFSGDKFPVGAFVEENLRLFQSQTIQLQKGDCLYLFSDGYADQFGGPKGKKFKYKQMQSVLLEVYNRPMPEQGKVLETRLFDWKGKLEQIDDILVVGIRL